jgi:hypothetical protein
MKGRAIVVLEPVAWVEWEHRDLRTLREVGRFVEQETPTVHAGLQSHRDRPPLVETLTNAAVPNPRPRWLQAPPAESILVPLVPPLDPRYTERP